MAREVTFTTGTVVGSRFLNDQQDVQSAEVWGVRLKKATNTLIAIAPAADGTPAGSASIRINGQPRLIAAQITTDLTGTAAGTRDVYALAGDGPDFTLVHVAGGSAAPADSRKLGEADWDGAQITALRNMIDAVPGHGWLHRPGGEDALPTGKAVTLAADSTNQEGTSPAFARADHVHQLDASIARKDSPVFTGFVDAPAYRVNGAPLASGHLSDGNTLVHTNDVRLADQRVPINNTVSTAKLQNQAVTLGKLDGMGLMTFLGQTSRNLTMRWVTRNEAIGQTSIASAYLGDYFATACVAVVLGSVQWFNNAAHSAYINPADAWIAYYPSGKGVHIICRNGNGFWLYPVVTLLMIGY